MNLLIVESPAKCRTISKYLGKDFQVLATYGHVRDLLPKQGSVDTEHDFAMHYEVIDRNKRHVDALIKAMRKADTLYLATDPDREGEAIAWHVCALLEERKVLKDKPVHRVQFHEITKKAIQEAVKNPGTLSMPLVNAQQARRALDYLVGFTLSPLLWRKIRRGLSAGRVQSPALRMIVERELEIEAFESREYWSITAHIKHAPQPIEAKLRCLRGTKVAQFTLENEEQAHTERERLLKVAQGELLVTTVEKKQRRRNPQPPFITSTLQQEAVRKLSFSTSRTMQIAQQLYEGVDLGSGSGSAGLITYMRTDSVNLASEAISDIRAWISQQHGADQIPKQPRVFKTKSKNAQEAHEAIRPTDVKNTPDQVKSHLNRDQFRLYQLIWQRAVASQMIHATINTVSIDLAAGNEGDLFRATGSVISKPGFMTLYQPHQDDKDEGSKLLPPMEQGDRLPLLDIINKQHFTEPPPRYSEATLVKTLEEHDIGRPSTYASIISTLQQREYVILEQRRFYPTDVARFVYRFLHNYFDRCVNYNFTAELEDQLDAVARGEAEWIPLLQKFWTPFYQQIQDTDKNVSRADVTQEPMDEDCPKCSKKLSVRLGRSGRFIGCTAYPDCDYTRNMDGEDDAQINEEVGRNCPDCDSPLIYRNGRFGRFIGCSAYPECRHIESLNKPVDTGVSCPQCQQKTLQKRTSKRGKPFYSCAGYPKCQYATWDLPLAKPCPKCDWPILTLRSTKTKGTFEICPQKGCDHKAEVELAATEDDD